MPRSNLATILLSTFLAMAALYSPQPLLPFFAALLSISESASASIISWSLLSMSIGPLFMGFLLQRYTPKQMLSCCLAGLAVLTLAFAFSPSFAWMKAIRFGVGAVISAQLAATMTYISTGATNMRQVMAYYVGAAVMGGVSGRISAGFIAEYADWRISYYVLGAALLLCLFRSLYLHETVHPKLSAFSLKKLWRVLNDSYVRRVYMAILCAFFVMTGILNFIPFRLESLDPAIGESVISLFYLGFVIGCFVTISAPRIADGIGGTYKAALLGISSMVLGLIVAALPFIATVFIAVTLITSGFFLLHTSTATLLNVYAGDQAGNVNSLYIAIYYFGGSAGSYLPGFLYASHGWIYFLGLLSLFILMSIIVMATIRVPGNAFLKVS